MSGLIFEGADASGKSTLAREIAEKTGVPLYLAGGKPKDDAQMWSMIKEQREALYTGKLVDRISSVSQQVYREGLFLRSDLMEEVRHLLHRGSIIVYCRPPERVLTDPSKHEWKPYDTEEWKQQILSKQLEYVARYDYLMTQFPCIIYDWTEESAFEIKQLLMDFRREGVKSALRDQMKRMTR
jgi:hypothetical protein